ncbi:MAG: C4-type zinc ribbon domain-containing protein [Bacteroidota bacterium]|nr:C4-type zinc ribbon domain-containing protein [Candidatus Kapabacteria bacterium]MDW8220902.1 C4-type zinc ribbon domain-containing protein [Bacteroidota bacterium]
MVLEQLQFLAAIAQIDNHLAELQEELGDLPHQVKALEKEVRSRQQAVDATQKHIDDILQTRAHAKIRAQELVDKQRKLSEQQFQVRNNREFDALTKEVEMLKAELREVEKTISSTMITEENLRRMYEAQLADMEEARERLAEREHELHNLSSEHNDEINELLSQRADLLAKLPKNLVVQYEHIREYHNDVAVVIRKNCCSGCFNAVPPQRIVEMRTYKTIFTCESCGRILYPEEMQLLPIHSYNAE